MPASFVDPRTDMPHAAAAGSPAVVGVAGGVGTSTVAVALGGLDLGVFTGRRADVVVCRATVASVLRAGRVAALCGRPVVAVTAVDTGKPSSALRSRLALLEPHTAAVVALPWVPQWRDLVDPLEQLRRADVRAGRAAAPTGRRLRRRSGRHPRRARLPDDQLRCTRFVSARASRRSAPGARCPGCPLPRTPGPPAPHTAAASRSRASPSRWSPGQVAARSGRPGHEHTRLRSRPTPGRRFLPGWARSPTRSSAG